MDNEHSNWLGKWESVNMTLSYIRRSDKGHVAAQLQSAITRAALRISGGTLLRVDCDKDAAFNGSQTGLHSAHYTIVTE
jgi:hypothetical protein